MMFCYNGYVGHYTDQSTNPWDCIKEAYRLLGH